MQNNISGQEAYELEKEKKSKDKLKDKAHSKSVANKILLWGLVILFLALTVFGMAWLLSQPRVGDNVESISSVNENDYIFGNRDAKTVLVEYSDFQCPACGAYHPVVKEILSQAKDDILFIYRHYPLPQHENADLAARVAESAGSQGKFWEMHDLLFENQTTWSELSTSKAEEVFMAYADTLGLNKAKFTEDLDNQAIKDKIFRNTTEGRLAGITGTPTFFINGEKMDSPRSFEEFIQTIEEAININTNQPEKSINDVESQ